MPRLSTLAVSTLVPALKVRSTTLPERMFLRVVRTNAPPLPGLTCWNSTTDQSCPSMLSTRPFLRSLVVATTGQSSSASAFEFAHAPVGTGDDHPVDRLAEQQSVLDDSRALLERA